MEYTYKVIEHQENLPIRLVLHRKRSYGFHWHKEMEIFLVLQGTLEIRTTDRHYSLGENEILILNSNEIHASDYSGLNPNMVVIIQLDLTFCKQYGYDFARVRIDRDSPTDDRTMRELKRCLLRMVIEMCVQQSGFHFEAMACLHRFVTLLVRDAPYTILDESAADLSQVDFARLNRIFRYMNENYYQENVSLKGFAEEEYLNVFYLSRFFKSRVGLTFSECLNQLRLQKAMEWLLTDPELSMIDVAMRAGFPNVKSFNRIFKERHRLTPFQYRKKMIEQEQTECRESGESSGAAGSRNTLDGFINEHTLRRLRELLHALEEGA